MELAKNVKQGISLELINFAINTPITVAQNMIKKEYVYIVKPITLSAKKIVFRVP